MKMKTLAVIFDIDGTLADCDHRKKHILKKPKDWDTFFKELENDSPIVGVVWLYKKLRSCSNWPQFEIIMITGRPKKYKKKTMDWLLSNNITPSKIFFREDGDFRNDDIVKKEIYEEKIEEKYNVMFVVEDRDRVVKMWRSLGLTTFQCAEGAF